MLKRLSQFFACLLLVLIPLQNIAAADMSICNSMMQSQASEQKLANMPCHQHMAGMSKIMQNKDNCPHENTCKAICNTLCASISAMSALPSDIQPATFLAASALLSMPHQPYASITQPNLQRPPIFLS